MTEGPNTRALLERLLLLEEAKEGFLPFVQAVRPAFKLSYFQHELIETLDSLEKQTLGPRNLLITMPPRHGKSWVASTLFPAYYMAREAHRKILAVSYGADLAKTFGRQVRDTLQEPIINQIFPTFELNESSLAVDDWMTSAGGKYYACGVGGGTTGRPANLLLIDDPTKSRADADSPTYRNKIWSYYNGSLVNRKEPEFDGTPAIEVLIQTRWHPDDLAGRIMESADWADGDWHHVNFPAIRSTRSIHPIPRYELASDDPLYMTAEETSELPVAEQKVGELQETALWPERFDLEFLKKMERREPREFAALYQQQPYIQGGNMIKTQWFNTYTAETLPTEFQTLIITVDTAFTTKAVSDYSVMMVSALGRDGNMYILDVIRERLDYPALKRKLILTNTIWRNKGLRGIYIEAAQSGTMLVQELRSTPGISVIPYSVHKSPGRNDKVTRANTVLPILEGGRVFIPEEAPWLDTFLEETQAFGANPKHDDQVDTLVMMMDVLSKVTIASDMFDDMPSMGRSLNQLAATNSSYSGFTSGSLRKDIDRRETIQSAWSKPLGEL